MNGLNGLIFTDNHYCTEQVGPVCSNAGSPEPHVWLGLKGQFNPATGEVNDTAGGGAYPSAYANSLGWYDKEVSPGVWDQGPEGPGRPMNTSDYLCGFSTAFPADAYSSEVQMAVVGGGNALGAPEGPEQSAALINGVAQMLNKSFTFGRDHFGIKIGVGVEIPLLGSNLNASHSAQEYWEGTFERVMAAYPIDEFWFWMPESWQWSAVPLSSPIVQTAVQDLLHAAAAKNATRAPFDLVTSGWTLGPLGDRGYTLDSASIYDASESHSTLFFLIRGSIIYLLNLTVLKLRDCAARVGTSTRCCRRSSLRWDPSKNGTAGSAPTLRTGLGEATPSSATRS